MSGAADEVGVGKAGSAVPAESVGRVEDARLLRGRGAFTDDLQIPGALYAHFVRSPHAHALLGDVDVAGALEVPGVVAAFNGRDLAEAGVRPIPTAWLIDRMHPGERRPLARDRVRFEGEPVAVIIAESPEAGRDAASAVVADYEPLPFVTDVEAAATAGAPTVYDDAPGNTCFEWSAGDEAAVDAAFDAAHHVVARKIRNNRLVPTPLEPRACAAIWTAGELRLHVATRNPDLHRFVIAGFVLDIPEHRLHIVPADIGGDFGARAAIQPEEVVVAWAARRLDRPVRWTATRQEAFLADSHGRDQLADAEMAFDADGRITGLRVRTLANLGANLSLHAAASPTWHYSTVLNGPYAIPAIHYSVRGVFSHTSPVDACRGAGRAEAVHVVERLIDMGAPALGVDAASIRRRNLIQPVGQSRGAPADTVHDIENYVDTFDRALELVGYDSLRAEQLRLREQGRFMGVGVACYVDMSGNPSIPGTPASGRGLSRARPVPGSGSAGESMGERAVEGARPAAQASPWVSARVRVHATGGVTVETGPTDQGQGHATTLAQIAAAALGVAVEDVAVTHGSAPSSPWGPARRGTAVGSGVWLAAQRVESKARLLASHLLGAGLSSVERSEGGYRVIGQPERRCTLREVAIAAHAAAGLPDGMDPGLEATAVFDPPECAGPFGTHVAVVDVDAETGEVAVRRYVAVDDCGNVINPAVVDGQIHGGVAQGIGQALWEEARYGSDGRLETRSLRAYGLPRAGNLPSFETARTVTPSSTNPLGVRGVGAVGAVAAPAAVSNAVMDALSPFGVTHLDMPLTSRKVWEAVRTSRRRTGAEG